VRTGDKNCGSHSGDVPAVAANASKVLSVAGKPLPEPQRFVDLQYLPAPGAQ
jgi:hypothetical protein